MSDGERVREETLGGRGVRPPATLLSRRRAQGSGVILPGAHRPPAGGPQAGRPPDAQQCRRCDLVREICCRGSELGTQPPLFDINGDVGIVHQQLIGNQQVSHGFSGNRGFLSRRSKERKADSDSHPLPRWSSTTRHSAKQSHLHRPRRPSCTPTWKKSPGALFQNTMLSKFHISTASSVNVQSSLWSPVKLWAVIQYDGDPPPRGSIARILSLCLGDSPDCFNVCTFRTHISTFLVANANIAAELLIRGRFFFFG
jgi:hypothetical protein